MAAPDESDPLQDLRDSLADEDDGVAFPSRPPAVSPSAKGAPPPLPPKRSVPPKPPPQTGEVALPKITAPLGAVIPAAAPASSLPLTIPGQVMRPPPGDPFQEPPEPRLSSAADPEDKLKFFRQVVKGKEEALARGRALYAAVDHEAISLRSVVNQLKAALDEAQGNASRYTEANEQVLALKDLLEKDTVRAEAAERKMDELIARLAEGEVERQDLSQAVNEVETQLHASQDLLAQEKKAKEKALAELHEAQQGLSAAQVRVAELTQEQSDAAAHQEAVESLSAEVLALKKSLRAVTAERDAALAELASTDSRLKASEAQAEELLGDVAAKASLEAELNDVRREGQTRLSALEDQLRESQTLARSQVQSLQKKLHSAEEQVKAFESERAGHEEALAQARQETDAASTKKIRDELNLANKKAMEATAALQKERKEREALAQALQDATARLEEHTAIAADNTQPNATSPAVVAAQAEEVARLEKEVASMKKKLVAAETAMETVGQLRAKVTRLEAQAKGGK